MGPLAAQFHRYIVSPRRNNKETLGVLLQKGSHITQ
jgi:hypothetical protein